MSQGLRFLFAARPDDKPSDVVIPKKILTAGGAGSDLPLGAVNRLLFTVFVRDDRGAPELHLSDGVKLKINGAPCPAVAKLAAGDRIESASHEFGWIVYAGVAAVRSDAPDNESESVRQTIQTLAGVAASLREGFSLKRASERLLDRVIELSGAEAASLLSETTDDDGAWTLVANRALDASGERETPSTHDLISGTVLGEAIRRREAVCIESLVGHPWARAESVVAAKVFSVACLPLKVDGRVTGALYLFTRSPGRSLAKERLNDLSDLATFAALLVAAHVRLATARLENEALRARLKRVEPNAGLVGVASPPMRELMDRLGKFAASEIPLLLQGETGAGKEILAREIHARSPRAKAPFVAVNCAAIPETLLESVLFGHERGAFTGAVRAQLGKFSLAEGGTLFLDEIGDLPLELQAKLLRALQEKEIEPLGAPKPKRVNVRVVAATHRDLEAAVRNGKFRQDLYFRLSGAVLRVPPLRERASDLEDLARFFAQRGSRALEFAPEAWTLLKTHAWPGNVRELEQVIERAAVLADGAVIQAEDLELSRLGHADPTHESFWKNLKDAQLEFTRDYVTKVLARNKGNRALTAGQLGISERSLYRLLAREDDTADSLT